MEKKSAALAKSKKRTTGTKEYPWVGLTVRTADADEEWYGLLDCSLDEFFKMKDGDYVRLNHVVWIENSDEFGESHIVANEDNLDIPFEHYIYFRKSDVQMIRPMKYPLNPPPVVE